MNWSALSSADPMQATAKILSLIDTVRYINWPRRLILYIYALWADSLESSGACNGSELMLPAKDYSGAFSSMRLATSSIPR
jgi:hypothetical protein